ncbi:MULTISPECIES: erythromycin esterase family protein [Actinoalloteichus]|uniref:erythromycin esterase family protein n=1 Tax=Actinoalloteichus TaxID=65496 RepID=UPI00095194F5|nr:MULTISPECIES: erythromycin esterase family protein [Actinoalloteichus]
MRESFMAESVRWHLDRSGPDARIVLAAHNNHVQKTSVSFDGALTGLPMGLHLHRLLGEDYRAIALTHTADHAPGDVSRRGGRTRVHGGRHPPRPARRGQHRSGAHRGGPR